MISHEIMLSLSSRVIFSAMSASVPKAVHKHLVNICLDKDISRENLNHICSVVVKREAPDQEAEIKNLPLSVYFFV